MRMVFKSEEETKHVQLYDINNSGDNKEFKLYLWFSSLE